MSQYSRDTFLNQHRAGPLYNSSRTRFSNVSTVAPVMLEVNTTGTGSVFADFIAVNTTTIGSWVSIYVTSTGTTTPTANDLIYSKVDLAKNESIALEKRFTLLPGDAIWALAGTSGVNVWVNLEVEI